jgi:hypothetical protein
MKVIDERWNVIRHHISFYFQAKKKKEKYEVSASPKSLQFQLVKLVTIGFSKNFNISDGS